MVLLLLDNLEWETVESRKTTIQLVMFFQDHQRPSGYSILQLPHTSQQQDEIQPLKEDGILITDFQISCQEANHDVFFLYSAVNVMVPG
jgi:hypothetical protein